MLSSIFRFDRLRGLRERRVRELAAAANALDYDRIVECLTEDFAMCDVGGACIEGRDVWAREDRLFREASGWPQVVIDSLDHNGEEVLVRGHLEGGKPEVGGATMWRVRFDGALISHVEVTREAMNVTLPAFATRRVRHEA